MDTGSLIRLARSRAGLTQRELADLAGTSAAAICQYENGSRDPGIATVTRIVAASGQTLTLFVEAAAIDTVRNGRILEELLELAEHLPYRRPSDNITTLPFVQLAR